MASADREPPDPPDPRADRAARPGVRRHPRRGQGGARRPRPPLHHEHDRDAPPAGGARPRAAARLAPPAGVDRRHDDAVAGQDPREHGDRPQRHARPVGLDERSRRSTPPPGTGTPPRPPRRGSTPTTTSTTRTRTSAARTATSATRSCGSTRIRSGIRSTSSSPSTTWSWRRSSSGASRPTTSTSTRSRSGEKSKAEVRRQLKGMAGKARSQIVKDYVAWPLISAAGDGRRGRLALRRGGAGRVEGAVAARAPRAACARSARPRRPTSPPTSSATSGPTRSSSAATSPTRPTPSARRRSPTRRRGALVRPPAAGRGEHRGQPALPRHQRQPRLPGRASPVPRHAQHAVRRDRARACARSASATSCPTTPGRSASSSARCSARSCGWRSRAESLVPSPVRTAATMQKRHPPGRWPPWPLEAAGLVAGGRLIG